MLLASILDYSVQHTNIVIDGFRLLASAMGAALSLSLVFLLKDWRCSDLPRPQKARYVALILFGVLSCLQEAQQIGKPFLVWRLPMILLASSIGLYGLYAEQWHRSFRVEDRPGPMRKNWRQVIENEQAKHPPTRPKARPPAEPELGEPEPEPSESKRSFE